MIGLRLLIYENVGKKRSFGDLEDDEDDFFGSKKVFQHYTPDLLLMSSLNYCFDLHFT